MRWSMHGGAHEPLSSARGLARPLAAAFVLSVAACSPSVKPPDVKLNSVPKERYEIVLTVPDPPGRISNVSGDAQFDIEGIMDDCMPYADKIAGVKPKSSFPFKVNFEPEADGSFVGYVYVDQLVDENYYGLGVCKWQLTGVRALFNAGTLSSIATIDNEQIINERTVRSLCPLAEGLRHLCLTPLDKRLYEQPANHYIAVLQSRKVQR